MDINPIILKLLKNRGVCDEADVLEFLSPSPKRTYDPFLMKGMEEAVELIGKHIEKHSSICIYGDYDTDGVTSVTLMLTALSKLTDNLTYYIPSRFSEGYGLNKEAIELIKKAGTDLIITVDCGSLSCDEVELAKELGMDVIVTDHHNIKDKQADCILLNPKQPGCEYPFDGLAGVGVAFKLVQAMTRRNMLPKSVISEIIDLTAIGTIGDIVPLVDENRTIVKFGLNEIKKGKRAGLRMLMNAVSISPQSISSENVAFIIVPHINAAGRLEDASIGVKLLVQDQKLAERGISEGSKDKYIKKEELVGKLVSCNKARKSLQEETFKKCVEKIEEDRKSKEDRNLSDAIILYAGKAHEGITGIVAGKLKDKYYRPIMIITDANEDGSLLKGTGRSIEGVDLYELLRPSDELFLKFGGHKGACGFSMEADNLELFRSQIAERMAELKKADSKLLERKNPAEITIDLRDVNFELIKELDLLAPFGAANPSPIFEIDKLVLENVFNMGNENQHARFSVMKSGAAKCQCVLFSKAAEYKQLLKNGNNVDVAVSLEENEWKGYTRLQLNVHAMRKSEEYING